MSIIRYTQKNLSTTYDMKSATAISRAVSPQRKSPTSDNQGKRGIPVMYSRGSWITSPF